MNRRGLAESDADAEAEQVEGHRAEGDPGIDPEPGQTILKIALDPAQAQGADRLVEGVPAVGIGALLGLVLAVPSARLAFAPVFRFAAAAERNPERVPARELDRDQRAFGGPALHARGDQRFDLADSALARGAEGEQNGVKGKNRRWRGQLAHQRQMGNVDGQIGPQADGHQRRRDRARTARAQADAQPPRAAVAHSQLAIEAEGGCPVGIGRLRLFFAPAEIDLPQPDILAGREVGPRILRQLLHECRQIRAVVAKIQLARDRALTVGDDEVEPGVHSRAARVHADVEPRFLSRLIGQNQAVDRSLVDNLGESGAAAADGLPDVADLERVAELHRRECPTPVFVTGRAGDVQFAAENHPRLQPHRKAAAAADGEVRVDHLHQAELEPARDHQVEAEAAEFFLLAVVLKRQFGDVNAGDGENLAAERGDDRGPVLSHHRRIHQRRQSLAAGQRARGEQLQRSGCQCCLGREFDDVAADIDFEIAESAEHRPPTRNHRAAEADRMDRKPGQRLPRSGIADLKIKMAKRPVAADQKVDIREADRLEKGEPGQHLDGVLDDLCPG